MLSNKHNHRSSEDMAPEPIGLLNKMRKSLTGKHFHRESNSEHASEAGSRSMAIPQMDRDTALAYMRDASFDKSRLVANTSVGTENGSHEKLLKSGSKNLESNSPPENDKLLNGTCTYTVIDENANKDDFLEPQKAEIGAFEKQGARPKVRKSSKTDSGLDRRSEDKIQMSGGEPSCVEMAQPHFPVPDTTKKPRQASMGSTTEEIGFDFKIPLAVPESTLCNLYQEMPSDSLADPSTCSDSNFTNSSTGIGENPARVRPKSSSLDNSKLESEPIGQQIFSNGCQKLEKQQFSEGPKGDVSMNNFICSKYILVEEPSTGVEEKEHLQHSLGSCDKNVPPSAITEQQNNTAESRIDIDQNKKDTTEDCLQSVESSDKSTGETETCSMDKPSKHCCTCTCNKSVIGLTDPHPGPLSISSDRSHKSKLTLKNIPGEVDISLEDSPKPPRTPNIEMLVNRNELFLDEHTKAKSLSEQELHMINWNAFSVCQDMLDATQRKEPQTNDLLSQEATQAFDNLEVSQSSDIPEAANSQDSHCILGAAGCSDTGLLRTKAPAVDRSSKPKELAEAASRAAAESPPPLPPRVPCSTAPTVPRRPAFSTFPIFVDDDDDDDFPTHEFLHEINIDFYVDPNTAIKSKSLPRNTSPIHRESPPELQAPKRGKTVNVRNRLSQMLKPGNKKKRHSTHGFPDRPLPDIPLNPRHPKVKETVKSNSSLFGTTTGDIVSQQAVREGLLREVPSKEEVDKDREQFAISLRRISEYGWYWGPMSWDDAETRLENMPDGSFLVRDSSDDRHLLSLSFRAQGSTHHTRVEHHNGKFSFWSQPCSHGSASIVEFVEEAMRHSHSGRVLYFLRPRMPGYPPAAVQLLYPISRFQKERSLQHMCRFVIRKHVRLDHIDNLPLPRRLRDYLKEAQYYTPEDISH